METPDVSLFLKAGYVSLVLSGIPLSSRDTRASSCFNWTTSIFCLLSRVSISVYATYLILNSETSNKKSELEIVYYGRVWVLFFWEVLLISIILLYRKRKELKTVFDLIRNVEEAVSRNQTCRDNAVLVWKTFIVSLTLVGASISALSNTFDISGSAKVNDTAVVLVVVYAYPTYLLTWVVCYNVVAILTTELHLRRTILKRICTEETNLRSVLTSVNAIVFCLHDPQLSSVALFREHSGGTEKLLGMFSAMKIFREYTNRHISTALTILIVANAFFTPLLFSPYYAKKYHFATSSLFGSYAYLNLFWITSVFLLPVVVKEWNKAVSERVVLTAKKDVYAVPDLRTKRMLSKLVASAGDKYPDSSWRWFCLDFAMISDIFDVTILLGTTFILPSGIIATAT